jgi:hypothetical protein
MRFLGSFGYKHYMASFNGIIKILSVRKLVFVLNPWCLLHAFWSIAGLLPPKLARFQDHILTLHTDVVFSCMSLLRSLLLRCPVGHMVWHTLGLPFFLQIVLSLWSNAVTCALWVLFSGSFVYAGLE